MSERRDWSGPWMPAGLVCGLLVVGLCLSEQLRAEDWSAFRGARGNGVSNDQGFPTEWSRDKNVRWRVAVPGPSNSSPIVSNGRVFVTSANGNGTERSLLCFDRADGKSLWVKTVKTLNVEETHGTNPYGSSTPVSDGERVVVWHGSPGLFCYDFAGNELWSVDLGNVNHIWGYGSSPVIADGRVFLNFGPGSETFLAAVKLADGELLWKHDEPGGTNDRGGRLVGSWSTPVLIEVDGQKQLLCSLATRAAAFDLGTGHVLWSCDGLSGPKGDLVYTSPVVGDGLAVCMGGYNGPAIGFRLGGQGNATESNRLWQETKGNPQRIGSGMIIGPHLFMANAGPGILQCLQAATGKELWHDRATGGEHWGAMVLAEGRIYTTNRNGATLVFRPNPEKFEQLAVNELGEASNSTPA
ncbi:MAG TPA: PQQ-binding-like beta-propeller repeat protein, partial [Planctomycetaceae bacterium]|nr:PQQ-binding-like beta-propeller repeat protein [Planctomycetaceae bacterium]